MATAQPFPGRHRLSCLPPCIFKEKKPSEAVKMLPGRMKTMSSLPHTRMRHRFTLHHKC